MTTNEKELLNIIREYDKSDRAIEIAIDTILGFLAQDVSSQEPPVACSRVSA